MSAFGKLIATSLLVGRGLLLVLGISALVFVLLRVVPGDLADMVASEGGFTPAMMEELRRDLGLDRPAYVQFGIWLTNAISGDFGLSLRYHQPVSTMVLEALPGTLRLGLLAITIGILLGFGAAIAAAIWPNRFLRGLVDGLNVWSVAVPTFCVGFLGILIFVLWLRWTPLTGNLWLPALILGIDVAGQIAKPLLEDIEEARNSLYVRAAQAKGVSRPAIIMRHVLPNAMTTALALVGVVLGGLAGGAVTMEVLFNHNGIGKLTLDSVLGRDYTVTQATVVVIAAVVVMSNTLMTLVSRLIDPRIGAARRAF
ncbi:MAG: ABC transporter permease [Beijerinckiaceae bacterium]